MAQVDRGKKSRWKDLRHLRWASIDNDDCLDLDQLTVAETLSDKTVKILVAIADVDALVKKSSAIDEHARQNTTSVYTAGKIFPMLPENVDYSTVIKAWMWETGLGYSSSTQMWRRGISISRRSARRFQRSRIHDRDPAAFDGNQER